MLKNNMYVRCPSDWEDNTNPRIFVCGKIKKIDEALNIATVEVHDPFNLGQFYTYITLGNVRYDVDKIQRCTLFDDSNVIYDSEIYKIICHKKDSDSEYYNYWLENVKTKQIINVSEAKIIAGFNNGRVNPCDQLINYEFQKSDWYLGRSIVSRNNYLLDHSFYGFRDLVGAKIYLLPHQVNTIMRCLEESPFRYMLADEVGMGKTIEAISILKIFLSNRSKQRVLILTPKALSKQWENELLFKFGIDIGKDERNNEIKLISFDDLNNKYCEKSYDLTIVDEVHRFLQDDTDYSKIHTLSKNSNNILLLSATPVQQERQEYLGLLRLLFPEKYDHYTEEEFGSLIEKQTKIVQKSAIVLDELESFLEIKEGALDAGEDPADSEDLSDSFDEIYDYLDDICSELKDEKLSELLDNISFDSDDFGEKAIRIILSYICSNYQLEGNVIRNRRKLLEQDDEKQKMATRELESFTYNLENSYESSAYEELGKLIKNEEISKDIKVSLLTSFFSSPWAFFNEIKNLERKGINFDLDLKNNAKYWLDYENKNCDQINEILSDPDSFEDEFNTRLVKIVDFIDQNGTAEKVVLFTSYSETFEKYKEVLLNLYPEENVSFFGTNMGSLESEVNSYKFQNNPKCFVMLCDNSGGEGRNFQCADYVIHIDLPWDANMIEQRIGRLDRLERDLERNTVTSVVVYSESTFEESVFKFWNEGLNIFCQSLSGMEIIIGKVNNEIYKSLGEDYELKLNEAIPSMINLMNGLSKTIKKEQSYDSAAILYKPMFTDLRNLIDYYTANEGKLFTDSVLSWASLAGFEGSSKGNDIFEYSKSSFSPRSALKSLLIPPKWDQYLEDRQNQIMMKILETLGKKQNKEFIRGTFSRKKAIENDYIHFFAPGDEIYECIIQNSMLSCKGQASAFKVSSNLNWKGFVFTWSVELNEDLLLKNNIPLSSVGQYKSLLSKSQIIIPISLENEEDYSNEEILSAYRRVLKKRVHSKDIVHLGRRGKGDSMACAKVLRMSNLEWFKYQYNEELWPDIVNDAKNKATKLAIKVYNQNNKIGRIKTEMDRVASAKIANNIYYDIKDEESEQFINQQKIILQTLMKPTLKLDSAAFIWMERDNG